MLTQPIEMVGWVIDWYNKNTNHIEIQLSWRLGRLKALVGQLKSRGFKPCHRSTLGGVRDKMQNHLILKSHIALQSLIEKFKGYKGFPLKLIISRYSFYYLGQVMSLNFGQPVRNRSKNRKLGFSLPQLQL